MSEATDIAEIRRVLERAVQRLCPGWLSASREDLVQNAALKILERQSSSEGNQALKASYLYKTAHSVLVDEIRRVQRRKESQLNEQALSTASGTADPERATLDRSMVEALRDCLRQMIEDRRLAVTLHLQGHRVVEIARLLQWPVKRTDNCVYRGLADLRTCLARKGIQPS